MFALAIFLSALGAKAASDMGPAAFMFPPDRTWSSEMDNTAPCGSSASSGNRTDFPLTDGNIALVGQDDSYNVRLSVSYADDPKSNDDFTSLISPQEFKDMDPGHACLSVPDAPTSKKTGDRATFQIVYIADFDSPNNQTFYACADITYVERKDFKTTPLCFNATEDDGNPHASGATLFPSPTAQPNTDGGSRKLSGGAIAGIVIGVVGGIALLAAAALLLTRRNEKIRRLARQRQSVRGVKPSEDSRKDSASQNSIPLRTLSS